MSLGKWKNGREQEFRKGHQLNRENDFSLDQAKYTATVEKLKNAEAFVILAIEIKAKDTNFRVSQWKTIETKRERKKKEGVDELSMAKYC